VIVAIAKFLALVAVCAVFLIAFLYVFFPEGY
jgi:hypothetical protein